MKSNCRKLIYITNTRVPSEKANTYQSFQMCNAFAGTYDRVEMWVPDSINTVEMKKIKNPFSFYDIEPTFSVRKLPVIDGWRLHDFNQLIWSQVRSISFVVSVLQKLMNEKNDRMHIFTRDLKVVSALKYLKRLGFLKAKVFYEAHTYSAHQAERLQGVDGLVVLNDRLKELYARHVDRILVAHDGVNLKTFKSVPEQYAKEKLGWDSEVSYLSYIGRFKTLGEEKGIPDALEAFARLDYRRLRIKLCFVGGPMEGVPEYKALSKRLGIDLAYIDFVDRQPVSFLKLYASASTAMLMPFPFTEHYAYYMSPLKMFEYMAVKRPIIATRLPSVCEVLNERNAILCEPGNAEEMALAMKRVIVEDCSTMAKQAYQDVQKYTWQERANGIWAYMCLM